MLGPPSETPVASIIQVEAARTAEELSKIAWQEHRHEWGGLTWGRVYFSRGGLVVWVAAMTPGVGQSSAVDYQMEPESYTLGLRMLRCAGFPADLEEVGMWHSHPSYGTFVSSVDEEYFHICFPQPWKLSIVLDPLRGDWGVYVKSLGRMLRIPAHIYAGDVLGRIPALDPRRAWDSVREGAR